jgi:hypothetical protein
MKFFLKVRIQFLTWNTFFLSPNIYQIPHSIFSCHCPFTVRHCWTCRFLSAYSNVIQRFRRLRRMKISALGVYLGEFSLHSRKDWISKKNISRYRIKTAQNCVLLFFKLFSTVVISLLPIYPHGMNVKQGVPSTLKFIFIFIKTGRFSGLNLTEKKVFCLFCWQASGRQLVTPLLICRPFFHLWFLRDIRIRTQKVCIDKQVRATNLATHP